MPMFRNTEDFDKTAKGNAGADRRRMAEGDGARRKAVQEGAAAADAVLQVMAALPSLMATSSQAEVERLRAIDPAHPRLAQVEASADALAQLAPLARRLQTRATRGLAIARAPVAGLHGFVEDDAGQPLSGLVVTLKGVAGSAPTATTADDGYFVLAIAKRGDGQPPDDTKAKPVTVVIRDKAGRALHEDPVPLDATFGVGYREYVIDGGSDTRSRRGSRRRARPK